jgi:dTDP-4-amino-4,6-dideoxygalactose transaminase
MTLVPVVDLGRQYDALRQELDEAVRAVMASGRYILGPAVEAFEERFAAYVGARYGIAVSSGTEAIRLSLLAAGIGRGDEVITVSFTPVPTVAAIMATGARPVLVDVDAETLTMDVEQARAAVGPRTAAIVPVHLYGHPAHMGPLLELARRHGLFLLEDACQAHGSAYQGRRLGALGNAGCFSFYPTKNLGGMGDGGMVVTDDPALAERLRMLRNHGQQERYHHVLPSLNSRFDDLQAAVLSVKLPHLDAWNERRRRIARRYREALAGAPLALPAEMPWAEHNYHLFVVRVEGREAFRQRLAELGVASDVHYPLPVHRQPAYRRLGYRRGSLPVSEWAAERVVSLPMFPELTDEEVERVAGAVREALAGRERPVAPLGRQRWPS